MYGFCYEAEISKIILRILWTIWDEQQIEISTKVWICKCLFYWEFSKFDGSGSNPANWMNLLYRLDFFFHKWEQLCNKKKNQRNNWKTKIQILNTIFIYIYLKSFKRVIKNHLNNLPLQFDHQIFNYDKNATSKLFDDQRSY